MLYPIILICLAGVPKAECVPQTALRVVTDIEPSKLPQMCIEYGEFAAAKMRIATGSDVYTKVMCEHRG